MNFLVYHLLSMDIYSLFAYFFGMYLVCNLLFIVLSVMFGVVEEVFRYDTRVFVKILFSALLGSVIKYSIDYFFENKIIIEIEFIATSSLVGVLSYIVYLISKYRG